MKLGSISVALSLFCSALSAPVSDASIVERSATGAIIRKGCPRGQQYDRRIGRCVRVGSGPLGVVFGGGKTGTSASKEEKRDILDPISAILCDEGETYSSLLMKCVNLGSYSPALVLGDSNAAGSAPKVAIKRNEEKRSSNWFLPNSCPRGQRWSSALKRCVRTGNPSIVVFGDGKPVTSAPKEGKRSLSSWILPSDCPQGQRWSSLLMSCVSTGSFSGIVFGDGKTGESAPKEVTKRGEGQEGDME